MPLTAYSWRRRHKKPFIRAFLFKSEIRNRQPWYRKHWLKISTVHSFKNIYRVAQKKWAVVLCQQLTFFWATLYSSPRHFSRHLECTGMKRERSWSVADIRVSVARGHVTSRAHRTCSVRRTWPRCHWQPGEWCSRQVGNGSGRSTSYGRRGVERVWWGVAVNTSSLHGDLLDRKTVDKHWSSVFHNLRTIALPAHRDAR